MRTKSRQLNTFNLTISERDLTKTRWQHKRLQETPVLTYKFAKEGHWRANDSRLENRTHEVSEWLQNFWSQRRALKQNKFIYIGPKRRRMPNLRQTVYQTNSKLYEQDLERAIIQSIDAVKQKWYEILKKDFERYFEDDLVKFVKFGKEPD